MVKNSQDAVWTLVTFFVFLVAFYLLGYWLIFRMAQATPLMLSVGMAAVATCLVRGRPLADLGWRWGEWSHQWTSYLLPLGIALTAYLIVWLAGFGDFYNAEFLAQKKADYNLADWSDLSILLFHVALVGSMGFFVSLPSILGEEIAWRGLLVTELSRLMSFTGVALISGLAWSVFHWPLIFKGLYGAEATPLYFQLFFFTLFITSTGVIMTYLRMKSGSLWTAVVYHASSNVFIQKVLTPITVENSDSAWYIDEFGAILALVACVAAIYYWRKGVAEFGAVHARTVKKYNSG